MSSRVATSGTFTAAILSSAELNGVSGGWIGRKTVTSDQGGITTPTDLTGLSETVTVGTSRLILITAWGRLSNSTGGSAHGCSLGIFEGATELSTGPTFSGIDDISSAVTTMALLTPTAGNHTYKLVGDIIGGGTGTLRASSTHPAMLLIQDLGPL